MEQYNRVVGLWQSYKIASIADLDKYLDSFRVLFAFHSGKIENEEINYHDTREIFENGRVVNYTGSPHTWHFSWIWKQTFLEVSWRVLLSI